MTSYHVNIDTYQDKEHKQLISHDVYFYETQSCAEFSAWDLVFNYVPEKYYPYVKIYITTSEYQTVEEEANADDYNH